MNTRARFAVVVVHPPEFRYAHFHFDTARYIVAGLRALGHPTSFQINRLDPDATNVLLGALTFRDGQKLQAMLSGHRYIHFHAELVTGRSINRSGDELHFDTVALPLFAGAQAVWCWSENERDTVAALGAPAHFLPFGYSEDMEEIERDVPPIHDAIFFGSTAGDRHAILAALGQRKLDVRVYFDHQALYRNHALARSRVALNLRHGDHMKQLPIYRVLYLVNNRCLAVGQTGTHGAHLTDLLHTDPARDTGEGLLDFIEEQIRSPDRQAVADHYYERLRTMPMAAFLAPVLDATFR